MGLNNFIIGLEILKKYYNDPSKYLMDVDDKTFRMDATDKPLSIRDIETMRDFRWFQETDEDMYGDEFDVEFYDSEQCWSFLM